MQSVFILSHLPSFQRAHWWLRSVLLAFFLLFFCHTDMQAAEINVTQAALEATSDGYRLSTAYSFELNHSLEDALMRGVPLYFTTDVQLTRQRWYWFDEIAVSVSRTVRIAFNVLTWRYHASTDDQLPQTFSSLEDVLALIRRPPRWIIADRNALKSGDVYKVGLRLRLDVTQLPKPFQIDALINSDWRLSSDRKEFTFKAE